MRQSKARYRKLDLLLRHSKLRKILLPVRQPEARYRILDLLLRCPCRPEVSTQDVAVPTLDGRQYRITLVQVPEDIHPPVMDLTLERLERDYDMPG